MIGLGQVSVLLCLGTLCGLQVHNATIISLYLGPRLLSSKHITLCGDQMIISLSTIYLRP